MGPGDFDSTSSNGATDVDVWDWQLYTSVSASVYNSKSRVRSLVLARIEAIIVQMNSSESALVCG